MIVAPGSSDPVSPQQILSIDEIVRLHSAGVNGAMHAAKSKARRELGLEAVPPFATSTAVKPRHLGIGLPVTPRETTNEPTPRAGARSPSLAIDTTRSTPPTTNRAVSTPLPRPAPIPVPEPARSMAHQMALHLRSAQLNKYITIPQPYPQRPLQVSYAEVGRPDGRPVLFFLGLGCVRYLIALYDELALAFGLRLICIDRWGYGKTDQVEAMDRGMIEWSGIVGKVCDSLGVRTYQIVAHSAGTPYALALAKRWPDRVQGKVHLLAPWVGQQHDSGESIPE